MKHKILTITALLALAILKASAVTYTITPGTLAQTLGEASPSDLVLTGEADARDLITISEIPRLAKLDISGLAIVEYKAAKPLYLSRFYFPANEIPEGLFLGSSISQIQLPASLSAIRPGTFAASALTAVEIPEGVTVIEAGAFANCPNLLTVTLPSTLREIGEKAFYGDPVLTSVEGNLAGLESIGDDAFAASPGLADIADISAVSHIGSRAFAGTALSALNLPGLESAAPFALAANDALTKVNAPESDAEGLYAYNANLTTTGDHGAVIPPYYVAASPQADFQRLLEEGSIISEYALTAGECEQLILGTNLTRIEKGNFLGISGLKKIDAAALDAVPEAAPELFADIERSQVKLLVKEEMLDLWKSAPVWQEFKIVKKGSTGIDEVEDLAQAGIRFSLEGNILTVTATAPLEHVQVYNDRGMVLVNASPRSESCRIEIPASSGILVVKAADSNGVVSTAKLIW